MSNVYKSAPIDYQPTMRIAFIRCTDEDKRSLLALCQQYMKVKDDEWIATDVIWVRVPTIEV